MDELIKLKAEAYDAISQIELWQKKLQEINAMIAKLQSKENEKNI